MSKLSFLASMKNSYLIGVWHLLSDLWNYCVSWSLCWASSAIYSSLGSNWISVYGSWTSSNSIFLSLLLSRINSLYISFTSQFNVFFLLNKHLHINFRYHLHLNLVEQLLHFIKKKIKYVSISITLINF
jgi:hypothetical protein